MNVWKGVLPIHPRRPPRPPFHHSCAWRLAPAKSRKPTNIGASPSPITRETIRTGVLLVKMMGTTHRARDRITGSCGVQGGDRPLPPVCLRSSLHPRPLVCIVHTYAGSPTKSAIQSHAFHPLGAVLSSVLYVCVVRDKRECIRKVPVHIFPKGSSRQTCRNSTSEIWKLSNYF